MCLRQVPRHEIQGHDLRPLRRQGDAFPRAPQADGPYRAGSSGRAHLVFQGDAQPPGNAARHAHHEPRADRLFPGLCRRRARRHAAQRAAAHDRGRIPQGERAVQARGPVQRRVPGRHGGRSCPQAALAARPGRAFKAASPGPDRDFQQAESQGLDQALEGGRGPARQRQPPRVDGPRVHSRDPA